MILRNFSTTGAEGARHNNRERHVCAAVPPELAERRLSDRVLHRRVPQEGRHGTVEPCHESGDREHHHPGPEARHVVQPEVDGAQRCRLDAGSHGFRHDDAERR